MDAVAERDAARSVQHGIWTDLAIIAERYVAGVVVPSAARAAQVCTDVDDAVLAVREFVFAAQRHAFGDRDVGQAAARRLDGFPEAAHEAVDQSAFCYAFAVVRSLVDTWSTFSARLRR